MQDSWGLKEAKKYFLVPMDEQKSLYYIGGPNKMLFFEMANDEKMVMASTGVNTEECYLLIKGTGKDCDLMISKMHDLIKSNAKERETKDS